MTKTVMREGQEDALENFASANFPSESDENSYFPSAWEEKFEFAKRTWGWWPDRAKLAEFIQFLGLIFNRE